jgi:MFS family permease
VTRIDLSPLRVREFRILLFSTGVSVFGDGVTSVALVFAVLDVTGSVTDVGLVLSFRVVPQILLLLMGGVIADRGRRDRVMALSQLASGVFQSALACLLLLGDAKLWAMALIYAAIGCAQAAFKPASSGLIRQLVPRRDLPAGNALMSMAQSTGLILGPALGGIVVAAGSPGMAIGIDATTFLVSAALLAKMDVALRYSPGNMQNMIRGLLDGWSVVRASKWLWGMIVFFSIFQFSVLGGLYVLGPAVTRSRLGGASAWGVMLAASGAGGLIGAGLALRWRPRRLLVGANAAVLGVVPAFLALSFAAPEIVVVAAMLLYGLSLGYGETLWESALQANVPAEKLSRVASYDWLGSTALRPLGLALAGPIALAIGANTELLGIAGIVVLGVLVLLNVPDVRQIGINVTAASVAVPAAGGQS